VSRSPSRGETKDDAEIAGGGIVHPGDPRLIRTRASFVHPSENQEHNAPIPDEVMSLVKERRTPFIHKTDPKFVDSCHIWGVW